MTAPPIRPLPSPIMMLRSYSNVPLSTGIPLTFTPDTISGVLLTVSNLLTSNVPVTLTSVTTDQATATADSLTYGPGGGGFSVVLR